MLPTAAAAAAAAVVVSMPIYTPMDGSLRAAGCDRRQAPPSPFHAPPLPAACPL